MNLLRKLFSKEKKKNHPKQVDQSLYENEKQLIQNFSNLSIDDRLKKIIFLGNPGETSTFKLLQHAIQYDPDLNVKSAALMKIHLFKGHPDLEPMLNELKETKKGDMVEPYFSIALCRMGLITIEEFERNINSVSGNH